MLSDPELGAFRPFHGFQGTNAPLPPDVASRLLELAAPRFVALGTEQPTTVAAELEAGQAIERHNATVRQELKRTIEALDPTAFELFVVRVLTELGFEVEHTGRTNDGASTPKP